MKGQDILLLLKLISIDACGGRDEFPFSVRALAEALGVSKSEISNSLRRNYESGLAIVDRRSGRPKANARALFDFIVSGLKYVFPARPGPFARGIATSFAAPALEGRVMSAGELKFVWPDAEGRDAGQSVVPLFKSVPFAIRKDPELYAYLALVDAVRLGNPREFGFARKELEKRMRRNG
jgi:DNA-binding transcriptional ArsR family regulator